MRLIYFLIALLASVTGSITGIGGGLIIKPSLDVMGDYDAAAIGILSSAAVLSMCIVSIAKQARKDVKIVPKTAVALVVGSIIGGVLGQTGFDVLAASSSNENVTVIQNIILAVMVSLVFIYMRLKDRLKSFNLKGILPSVIIGLCLGVISSFLGIGGGPFNVAVFILLFSFDIKRATVYSLITILSSQAAKLIIAAATTGFAGFDLTMLTVMLAGALAGGILGSIIKKRLSEKTVELCFSLVQVFVFAVCIINIWRVR